MKDSDMGTPPSERAVKFIRRVQLSDEGSLWGVKVRWAEFFHLKLPSIGSNPWEKLKADSTDDLSMSQENSIEIGSAGCNTGYGLRASTVGTLFKRLK